MFNFKSWNPFAPFRLAYYEVRTFCDRIVSTFLVPLYIYYYMMTYAPLPNPIESIPAQGLDELLFSCKLVNG